MLKKEDIKKVAALLKLKEADLKAAMTGDEEKELAFGDEELHVYSESELATLRDNERKAAYKDGSTATLEMAVKDAKKKFELDFQGKTLDGLLESFKTKVLADAKLKPDEKVVEMEQQIATLKKTVTEQETAITEKTNLLNQTAIDNDIMSHIPELKNENGPALTRKDIYALMQMRGYKFKKENDAIVAEKDGQVFRDKVGNPLSSKDVVNSFLTENKYIPHEQEPPSGYGGGSAGGNGKAMKTSDLTAQFEKQGKSTLGEEFAAAVSAAAKDNPDFKFEE